MEICFGGKEGWSRAPAPTWMKTWYWGLSMKAGQHETIWMLGDLGSVFRSWNAAGQIGALGQRILE